MAILDCIRNSVPYRLYENDNLEGAVFNRDMGIAELIYTNAHVYIHQ